ncbi:hypothetical protein PG997_005268 [Apiospora hydei]|uniref:Uncharacterized protein n=1 Tax=Apiospora hydei TaxID=1337664 RepID=A0ABR1X4J8_9PEZI
MRRSRRLAVRLHLCRPPEQGTQYLTKTMSNKLSMVGQSTPAAAPSQAPAASQAPGAPAAPPVVQAPAAAGGAPLVCPVGCEPKTVYVTVTAPAPAPPAVTVTVQPPFPMSSGVAARSGTIGTIGGTGVMPGTGNNSNKMYAATTMPSSGGGGMAASDGAAGDSGMMNMATPTATQPVAAYRRWFRREREHLHRRHHH